MHGTPQHRKEQKSNCHRMHLISNCPETPNHALQRTAPCVTAPASAAAFPPAMQVPRRTPRSLSLGSLDLSMRTPKLKKRKAWLITWEGMPYTLKDLGRPRVVAILKSQICETTIEKILPALFINTELLIQLDLGDSPTKGRHWFCDVAAADFRANTFYLCEVTYSKSMSALATRLISWSTHWPEIRQALFRDCGVPATWQIKPRAFIPLEYHETLKKRLAAISHRDDDEHAMPPPLITYLESIVPWKYKSWDRKLEALEQET